MPTTTASLTQSTWNAHAAPTSVAFAWLANAVAAVAVITDPNSSTMWLRFAMPANPGGATITKVTLDAACNANGYGVNGVGYEIHKMTRGTWVETTATWNNYNTGLAWTTPGGDYNATVVNTIP